MQTKTRQAFASLLPSENLFGSGIGARFERFCFAPEDPLPAPAPAPAPADPPAPAPAPAEDDAPIYTKADLARLVRDRLDQEKRVSDKRIADEKAAAEQQRLKEQGEYKVLAEQYQREKEALEEQIAAKDRDALRVKVGTAAKLPQPLWARILGATEAEMAADAAELAKTVAPPTAPNINPGSPANGGGKPTVEAARDRLLKSGDYHRV